MPFIGLDLWLLAVSNRAWLIKWIILSRENGSVRTEKTERHLPFLTGVVGDVLVGEELAAISACRSADRFLSSTPVYQCPF